MSLAGEEVTCHSGSQEAVGRCHLQITLDVRPNTAWSTRKNLLLFV